jgi:hypothetical protein
VNDNQTCSIQQRHNLQEQRYCAFRWCLTLGMMPRTTATAAPTMLRIWCSMKLSPHTSSRKQGTPPVAAAAAAAAATAYTHVGWV